MPSSTTSTASQIRHIRPTTAETGTTHPNGTSHGTTSQHERLHFETLSKLTSLPGQQPDASSSSTHSDLPTHTTTSKLFSPQHLSAIESLRQAQLSLAQTYILSSHAPTTTAHPNNSTTNTVTSANAHHAPNSTSAPPNAEHEAAEKERKGLDEAHQKIFSAGGTTTTTTSMAGGDDGVSVDLQLARRRRAANQRLFERTRELVGQVGQRLDTVAAAMRGVERESRGIWESDSEAGGA